MNDNKTILLRSLFFFPPTRKEDDGISTFSRESLQISKTDEMRLVSSNDISKYNTRRRTVGHERADDRRFQLIILFFRRPQSRSTRLIRSNHISFYIVINRKRAFPPSSALCAWPKTNNTVRIAWYRYRFPKIFIIILFIFLFYLIFIKIFIPDTMKRDETTDEIEIIGLRARVYRKRKLVWNELRKSRGRKPFGYNDKLSIITFRYPMKISTVVSVRDMKSSNNKTLR